MADSPLHLTKREMQAAIGNRGAWITIVAAGIVLGIGGPFGTDDYLRLVPRLAYWAVIVAVGYFGGSFVSTLMGNLLRQWRMPYWPSVVLGGASAGAVLAVLLIGLNTAVFGSGFLDAPTVIPLTINVVVISMVITTTYVAILRHFRAEVETATAPTPARILARVPIEKRGQLLALSVQDHYVEVITDKGSALVLLRLSDAMQEIGDVAGLQVHRSHWVATKAVVSVARDGAKAVLTLTNGRDIPVSRTYVPAIKEAGLLPR